jgi:D-amino-acid dehydrogenase
MNPRKAETGLNAWRRAPLGATRFRELRRDELDGYAGTLRTPPHAGILFSGTAQMCEPQAARDALLSAFTARGGETIADEARLISHNGEISVAFASGARRSADAVLVAAGAWSSALMRQLGVVAPLIGERGYSVHSTAHSWPAELPPTVFEERSLVVSRFDSGLRASSFLEFGRPDAPGDPRKWRALQRHLATLGIAFSDTPDRWVGPRPTLPDYLPAIGRLGSAPNIFYAFGHQHLGVTNAAITAEIIEALATGKIAPLDVAPFRIERFA